MQISIYIVNNQELTTLAHGAGITGNIRANNTFKNPIIQSVWS